MRSAVFFAIDGLVYFAFISLQFCSCGAEEVATIKQPNVPLFHNLIPRFKMPRGNLLRYKIPQWEVLYFLKYGLVPYVFYDPNFNRTNFIAQVHKFKLYFDDGRPTRIAQLLKDVAAFREFMEKHGYPVNQDLEDALSQNNKIAAEIEEILTSASNGESLDPDKILDLNSTLLSIVGEKLEPSLFPNLDLFMEGLDPGISLKSSSAEKIDSSKTSKRTDTMYQRNLESFWHNIIHKYPFPFTANAMLKARGFLVEHNPGWARRRLPVLRRGGSELRRQTKSYGLLLRDEGEDYGGIGGDDRDKGMDLMGVRNGAKKYQTQGWK